MLKPGDTAPDFSTRTHTGDPIKLSDFRGKTLVLWFFPKSDTPGCTAEACSFRDLKAEFAKKNAAIVGVSFDTAEEQKAFANKFHFNFPLIPDTERKLGVAYGAADDPSASNARRIGVVIDGDGQIAEYHPKVDARTWPTDVYEHI